VHLNGFANVIQWQAWLWARLRGARIVMRGDGDVLRDAGSAGLKTLLSRFMTRLFTSGADRVFYQGDSNLDYWAVRGACGPQLRWVPCVPDSHVFRAAAFSGGAEREAFRTAEGVQSGDCVFLVSGKLELRKRPKDAIEALARMEAKNAHVWFLGSGVLEEELKVYAARLGVGKRVRFWGFQNQTQMPRILQAADVCLHLSQIDPWPYSVLECALSGQALLLSDRTGSYPDLVGAAGGGLTFPCGDLDALAVRMSGLAGDPAKVLSFKEKLRVELDRYTEDVFCGIFEQAVNEMVPA
jgi:glycosyltransferase involved in cell wall biosynthesis